MSGHEPVVHEVDGIIEEDNKLPNWWLWILYGTTAFALAYWLWFHVFQVSPQGVVAYRLERAAHAARLAANRPAGGLDAKRLAALAADAHAVDEGAKVFAATCAPCHAEKGEGRIGPNLTDDYWLNGGSPEKIYATIAEGRIEKGMPAWAPQLGDEKVGNLTAFILTLRGKNVPGKPPRGVKGGG